MTPNIGILLVNLGTPEATEYWPMRRYLKEFLSDPRVIEKRGPLWWLILNGLILTRRPQKSGRAYDRIWNRERDESPLKTISRAQAETLAQRFCDTPNITVDWAMRYGSPSISDGIARLQKAGCDRVLLFPLYPQYSAATTATALDKTFEALAKLRVQPALRTVPPYYQSPAYIGALKRSIILHLAGLDWKPDLIIASFHGLPTAFIEKGDPYQTHCEQTFALLRDAIGSDGPPLHLTYQSRPGRGTWLGPDLERSVIEQARGGATGLCVIAPGFAADCVETLEEIHIRAKQSFLDNGGGRFTVVPCLNDSPDAIDMMQSIITRQIANW